MNVLITGGAGFIGRHIAEHFQDKAEVRVLDNLRTGFERNLDGLRCDFWRGSILDRTFVRKAMHGVDYVFHLAAFVSVPESIAKPEECASINVAGTLVVLEEAATARVKKVIFSSSAAIYGDDPRIPKIEDMPPSPKSPYACSKLEGERLCRQFTDEDRLSTISLRYFNVFGPFQNPQSQYAAAIPAFIERSIHDEPITIYGDGRQTRDFIFVSDVAAANAFFATESSATGVFNIACEQPTSIQELCRLIKKLTQSTSSIVHAADRPGDVKHSVAAIGKALAAGFAPSCDFTNGLKDTIAFFKRAKIPNKFPHKDGSHP